MWRFLAVCGFVQVACQGLLVREACVGVLVGGAGFLLPPFEDLGCFSGCLMSSAGIQKLFCGISSLWVGLDGWLVNVSWLEKLVLVFWWVELDFFSLECNEVSSNEL